MSIPGMVARLWREIAACGRVENEGTAMKYALLIYENEVLYGPNKAGPEMDAIVREHMAFSQQLGPKRVGGAGLKGTATATTVRRSGGKITLHDGPFAETKEQLGGFYLIDAADLDEAISIAKKLPIAQDGSIEVRPLLGG